MNCFSDVISGISTNKILYYTPHLVPECLGRLLGLNYEIQRRLHFEVGGRQRVKFWQLYVGLARQTNFRKFCF